MCDALVHEVIKRDAVEGDKAIEAQKLINRAAGKALRQKRAKGEIADTILVDEPAAEAAPPAAE